MGWKTSSLVEKDKLKMTFYSDVDAINHKHWEAVNKDENIYLSLSYLKAIETSLQEEVQQRYALFYKNDEPVAIMLAQIVRFKDAGSKYNDQLCKLSTQIKTKILKAVDAKVLVCGNVFACGENGFVHTDAISPDIAYDNLNLALARIRKSEKENDQTAAILLKDFWPESFKYSDKLKKNHYRGFMVDVNMILKIQPSWTNLDDYLNSMTTKFRTKAKGAFKKSAAIVTKDFSVKDIEKHQDRIEKLYDIVQEKADFNIGTLNGSTFVALKTNLKNQFQLFGYFLADKLVGFSSLFIHNGIVDANYVGLDYEYNFNYAVYQKILYDFVDIAIKNDANELRLGRTAEEIKSCLGAEPINMKLYLKHHNLLSNSILKPIIETITPSEFHLRKPFKAQVAT